jgi:hypothetical protein
MNTKRITGLGLGGVWIVFVMATGLLFIVSSQTLSAQPSDPSASNSNQEAIDHINQAQSALDNGDTEGAKGHLDLAKKALGCDRAIDPNC